jgi:cytochrome d ubiquinol oxidase subunit I
MDVLLLSRLQFAAATMFHFLFVPLTLGLSVLVAYMETKYVSTGDETYLKMTKFWGKLFLINFALGVVTGITLEFQFGTNWSRYSSYVGDIFGSLLAIEATAAFFLESTLLGAWVFGWKKLSKKTHAAMIWLVAFASNLSAVWILVANSWMQEPVGYAMRNGRAELTDFAAVVFSKFGILTILHTLPAAFILSSFFVMSICAYHLLKKQQVDFFTRSFKIAVVFGLVSSIFIAIEGDQHAVHVTATQPEKLAAMEAHWETSSRAPMTLFAIPSQEAEKNLVEIGSIPGMLSWLGFHDFNAEVKGLKAFPKEDRPPVLLTFFSFRLMVALGAYFILMTLIGFFKRNKLTESPGYLKLIMWSIPLPYLAVEFGWLVAEVGRQPWIVYRLMRAAQAVSPIDVIQVVLTLAGFIVVYGLLGVVDFYLLAKYARKGPALESNMALETSL